MHDALILRYRHLPEATARRLRHLLPPGLELADMVGAGNLGLCRAAMEFDPGRGVLFSTYAILVIRGAILQMLREWDFYPRSFRAAEKAQGGESTPLPISLDAPVPGPNGAEGEPLADLIRDEGDGPDAIALRNIDMALAAGAIDALPERERDTIWAYYRGERTLSEIAAAMGLSDSRVYQIRNRALARLRENPGLQALAGIDEDDLLGDVLCDRPGEV